MLLAGRGRPLRSKSTLGGVQPAASPVASIRINKRRSGARDIARCQRGADASSSAAGSSLPASNKSNSKRWMISDGPAKGMFRVTGAFAGHRPFRENSPPLRRGLVHCHPGPGADHPTSTSPLPPLSSRATAAPDGAVAEWSKAHAWKSRRE